MAMSQKFREIEILQYCGKFMTKNLSPKIVKSYKIEGGGAARELNIKVVKYIKLREIIR